MVKLCFAWIVLISGLHLKSFSQALVPSKGTDHVEFANVVLADSLSKQMLFQNARNWVGALSQKDEKVTFTLKDSIEGKVFGRISFFVYSQSGILRKISGAISYNLFLEVKDNKYRYRFSDFVFHYYKQDRYYSMVETGKTKPLEDLEAPGWQKLWTHHKSTTFVKMRDQIKDLVIKMVERKGVADEKKIVVEW